MGSAFHSNPVVPVVENAHLTRSCRVFGHRGDFVMLFTVIEDSREQTAQVRIDRTELCHKGFVLCQDVRVSGKLREQLGDWDLHTRRVDGHG